jgi:capsular polysaccharide biosynthesis protein
MPTSPLVQQARIHTPRLVAGFVLGAVVALLLSLLRPLEYRSSMTLLITQQAGSSDAYTASRSAERLADDLARYVGTSNFFESVLTANFGVDASQFPPAQTQEAKRRKAWKKMVLTSVTRGTGMLTISVYNENPDQANRISQAIAFVLTQEGWRYTSVGNISVRLVNAPLASRWPVRPNLPANTLGGGVLGLLAVGAWALRGEAQRKR